MWFDRKRREQVTETQPEHWPTERMITEGHADHATQNDLVGLDENTLLDLAEICLVETLAPDECIPCLAYVMVQERRKEAAQRALEELNPHPQDVENQAVAVMQQSFDAGGTFQDVQEAGEKVVAGAYLDERPVAERFAAEVRVLDLLVSELLEGPPIPPPNVSEDELALLVVAAQRWIKMTEAQGIDLPPAQKQVLDATTALVTRLHRG